PTGATPVTPGAPANPYAPPGSGQVLGTQPPYYAPAQPPQPEGQPGPQQQGGIFLGGAVTTVHRGSGEAAQAEVPEVHVVQKGDTLWDICKFYFANPWRWPEIWGMNPQITNPHWIYPGNVVRLQAGGTGAPKEIAPVPPPSGASTSVPDAEATA